MLGLLVNGHRVWKRSCRVNGLLRRRRDLDCRHRLLVWALDKSVILVPGSTITPDTLALGFSRARWMDGVVCACTS
jgi:hypothetical protein